MMLKLHLKKVRAVLIRYEDFQTRLLDKQIEEEQELFYKQIKSHVLLL